MDNKIKFGKKNLEILYQKFNKRQYVHPDPLEFLYNYPNLKDREIAALVASSLAYGRVAQILKSVSLVLDIMGKSPKAFLTDNSINTLKKYFKNFKHRFATGTHLSFMLAGAKKLVKEYGSLHECFLSGLKKTDKTIFSAMDIFSQRLVENGNPGHLIPLPKRGSACKRMNLFLRWMVRKDDVDPGGWDRVLPAKLIIPLDVHMHKISMNLGLTQRKQANMKTALEITSKFAKYAPDDPVKYDFALTRFGIREEISYNDLEKFK